MQNLTKFANRATIWVIYELRFVCNWFNRPTLFERLFRTLYDTFNSSFVLCFCFVSKVPLKWHPISRLIWFLQCLSAVAYRLPHAFCYQSPVFLFCRFLPSDFLSSFSHSFHPPKWVLCVHRNVSYDRVLSVTHLSESQWWCWNVLCRRM